MGSVLGKLCSRGRPVIPPLTCSQVLGKQYTRREAVGDWNGCQGSGPSLVSATLKLGHPTIQLNRFPIS